MTPRGLAAILVALWLGVPLHAEQRATHPYLGITCIDRTESTPRAVQAIGLSQDGRTLTLFTVDKSGGSEGMAVGEVAELLVRDYGVWNALNLDGGGSTTLALDDPATHAASVVNVSSDKDPVAGRSVGSSLAVFARPSP